VAGEKIGRTLEPVLAAPLRTWQLLAAKSLTALVPTVLATWLAGSLFIVEVSLMELSPLEMPLIISPGWLLSMILMVPVMALIPIGVTVIISSRITDLRAVQQFATIVGLVLGLAIVGVTIGILLTPLNVLGISAILLLIGIGILFVATRLFQREAILTRWV
jgi:ABC-2 type transport system permease protein